ncbi:hypothetical protein RB195_007590 [Necator americanus]|uniref:Uncharacterized protein n=1 Tax=Necator americanus TaxID=51031 RepID=A0ABR1BY37_NECAM
MNADTMDEEHEEEHQHTVGNDQETDSMEQSELNPEQEIQTKQPEMDEDDIAEMSMIAAQIESAEDFNLTFEAVDTSELHEEEISKGKGKRRRSKDVSPLYVSDREEIEEFLEEGINDSVVEKANTSVAELLLSEWGSPKVDPKRLRTPSLPPAEMKSEKDKGFLSTPKSRQPLKDLVQRSSSNRKRLSSSSSESNALSPCRKRGFSTSKDDEQNETSRKVSSNILKNSHIPSPTKVLKARNV